MTTAAEREVVEESGVAIKVTRLAGVYTDPGHVMVYPATGEARQQFAFMANDRQRTSDPCPLGTRASDCSCRRRAPAG